MDRFTRELLAERVRFELTGLSSSGFQDRRNRPLCHLSVALFTLSFADTVAVGGYPNLPVWEVILGGIGVLPGALRNRSPRHGRRLLV